MIFVGWMAVVWILALETADWSRFRGPNGTGVADEAALPERFGHQENLVWRTPLPPGHSSPIVSGERVFVTGAAEDALLTFALDRTSGRVVWTARVRRDRKLHVDKRNHPASPTPASDGENVYVFFQDLGLLSYDPAGRERWRLPLGPFTNMYGMAASPILAGNLVVLVCDQSLGSFMIAVERTTGRIRWQVDRPEATSGHSTPVLFQADNEPPQLLVPGSFYLTSYDVETGRRLWWTGGLAFEMKATPVVDGRVVYISGTTAASFEDSYGRNIPAFADVRQADRNGDGRFSRDELPDALARRWFRLLDLDGDAFVDEAEWTRYREARRSAGGLWAFRIGGTGDLTGRNALWHYQKAVPQLPSPLLYRGLLYIISDGGVLTALDPRTGTPVSQQRLQQALDAYYASPVAGDGKIFLVTESGRIVVLKAGDTPKILAVNDLAEPAYATPAISGGRLYLRTASALYCFGAVR